METTPAYYLPTTAYYPTTYYQYYPTTYTSSVLVDRAVVPTEYVTTSSCCGTQVVAAVTPSVRALRPNDRPRAEIQPRRALGAQEPGREEEQPPIARVSARHPPRCGRLPPGVGSHSRGTDGGTPAAGATESPPSPPLPVREQAAVPPAKKPAPAQTNPAPAASTAGKTPEQTGEPPAQPANAAERPAGAGSPPRRALADGPGLEPAPLDTGPGPPGMKPRSRPATRPAHSTEFRNILFGSVKGRSTGEVQEGVRVTLSSRTNAFEDRVPRDRRRGPIRRPGSRRRLDREGDHAQRQGLFGQPDHREQRGDHRRDRPGYSSLVITR